MRTPLFILVAVIVAGLVFAGARAVGNDYVFFAGYTVLQFVVLATAWNILGGYTGYVNFGTAAFFALGAYSTVFFHKIYPLPIPLLVVVGAAVSGLVGLGMGYLDAATARRLLRHRDARDGGGAPDAGRQLGLCRRLARRLCDPARGAGNAAPALHPVPVPGDAGARGHRRSSSRAPSSAPSSATASPPSATTSSPQKPPACRRYASS